MKRSRVNPVARAVAKKTMGDQLRDLAIKAHMTQDGEIDQDLLGQFAFVIGVGAQVSLTLGGDIPRTKRMHAALRSLVAASVDGGKWPGAQSAHLYDVAKEACKLAIDRVDLGLDAYSDACFISDRIRSGTATMNDVRGAEIYKEAA